MVGTHHRIPMAWVNAFGAWEREQMTTGREELFRMQNELGLFEWPLLRLTNARRFESSSIPA